MAHNNGMVPHSGGSHSYSSGFGEMTGAEIAGFVPHRPARPEKSEGGKAFKLVMCTVGHWKNGTMDEEYLFWDNQSYMTQLGLGK